MTRRRATAVVFALILLSVIAFRANADPILADLTGSRSVGPGITATNGSKNGLGWASQGFRLTWVITPQPAGYTYVYTLDPQGQGGVSHFILEVSENVTASNWNQYFSFPAGQSVLPPQWWEEGQGNPNLPAPIWGIKFDFGGDPVTYTFLSTKIPIWGDFYAKDGAFGQAWNAGFGQTPIGPDYTSWIATPDTASVHAPEPASLVLLGTGLVGLARAIRRRR